MKPHEATALASQREAFGALSLETRLHPGRGQDDPCTEGRPLAVPARRTLEHDSELVYGFYETLNVNFGEIGHWRVH